MSTKAIEAGRAFLKLMIDSEEFKAGIDGAMSQLNSFANSTLRIAAQVGAVGAAISAPFAASLKVFSDTGSELYDLSRATGVTVEQLSVLKFAAGQSGASLTTLATAARNMQSNGLDPSKFSAVAKEIAAIEDPTKRAQAAFDAFGKKAGSALLPMIGDLAELTAQAEQSGIVLSGEAAESADALGDAFGLLEAQSVALAQAIAQSVAPAVTKMAAKLASANAVVIRFVQNNHSLVAAGGAVALGVDGIASALVTLGGAAKGASIALEILRGVMNLLAKHPYAIIVTAGIAAVVAAMSPLIDSWLGLSDVTDDATTSTEKHTATQGKLTTAMQAGTKAVQERSAAMEQLSARERSLAKAAQQRADREKTNKEAADLRNKGRIEEIDDQIQLAKRQLEDAQRNQVFERRNRRSESGAAFYQRDIDRARQRIADLEAERRELTGEADKERAEAAKRQQEFQQEQEQLREQQRRAQEQRANEVASLRDSLLNQVESATRGFRGGSGGRFAEQLAGAKRSEDIEQRMLKIEEKMLDRLDELVRQWRGAKPLMVTNL